VGQSALPIARGRAHVAAFCRAGWRLDRIKGSHHILVKEGGATLSVPCNDHKDLKRGLLQDLIKAAGLTEAEYMDLFHKRRSTRDSN
jgi:predicted RNA binding protein YcfA (HicA-like mRNA interferase family)